MEKINRKERAKIRALKEALAGRAMSDLPWRPEADHRLALYRTPAGDLMCLARCGSLSSETPVTIARCGTAQGCNGVWQCLAIKQIGSAVQR
ncbi:hypothetical protein ASE00_07265 [Sphingomonas sp. Root710]|uniref:hypothetical protein n=1 Tax=Sphingomonas sp. Root710 TaxID=1736594 RepID=UPI0006FCE312|nr:hypothetical protein [Sphingomonas sp. Root710]KRB86490.1 hypothetical protein ASE00_07265 [Sphingomonas sp. Root710]